MGSFSIKNFTRRPRPRSSYAEAAELALPAWDLSLVFVGSTRARALNKKLRGKEYIPNVLSYEVGTKSGEIIICLSEAARQAPAYGMERGIFVLSLFIHALLHLKGMAHSATMEKRERALLARTASPRALARLPTLHGTTH